MISVNPPALKAGQRVRPAVSSDYQQIADLIFFEGHVHRHLDWRTPLEWLGYSPYWVLEENGRVVAALACPPDPDSIAWIRLFVYASHLSGSSVWSPLWTAARRELAQRGRMTAAAIAMERWMDSLLIENGFGLAHHIVLLEWNDRPVMPLSIPAGYFIRTMKSDDLPRVVEVDASAFDLLWQNSLPALSKAFSQAVYASVIERDSDMVGYQLSTWSPLGAHLARLAVRPQAQGIGLGTALVNDLIIHMQNGGARHITVNTQGNNNVSLALYQKLGFRRTGEQYPVYTIRVE
jgi:ribosomal protein S18 acetylase RimI-like enzyme